MDEIQKNRIEERMIGVRAAKVVLELLFSESSGFDSVDGSSSAVGRQAFWQEIHRQLKDHLPGPKEVLIKAKPMDNEARKAFSQQTLRFGEHQGETVDTVLRYHPSYLVWMANETFQDDLRRYLGTDSVKEYLRNKGLIEDEIV